MYRSTSPSPNKIIHGGLLNADLLHIRILLRLQGKRLRLHGFNVLPRLHALRRRRWRRPVIDRQRAQHDAEESHGTTEYRSGKHLLHCRGFRCVDVQVRGSAMVRVQFTRKVTFELNLWWVTWLGSIGVHCCVSRGHSPNAEKRISTTLPGLRFNVWVAFRRQVYPVRFFICARYLKPIIGKMVLAPQVLTRP